VKVTAVEVVHFSYDLPDLRTDPRLGVPLYSPGSTWTRAVYVVRVVSDSGLVGEYVGDRPADAQIETAARVLLGRDPLDREGFFALAKHRALLGGHLMGIGVLDVALWDLAGKFYQAPLYQLLGGARRRLPTYASTHVGDREPDGLATPDAYAELAKQCLELGYRAFKIHPWPDGDANDQIALVRAVGRQVGDEMQLMLDSFNSLRTFGDAVRVGRACDDHGYFWFEDPYRDGGVSAQGHRRLRQLIRTPILALEHVRGLETHVDWIQADATDFVRLDPDYDGVTGSMKIAHAAEGFGLDVELHGSGPVRRHMMAALQNTNFYEMSLVHPRTGPFHPPVFGGYDDATEAIGADGCVEVPDGPGLGVELDWEFIRRHEIDTVRYASDD
jgi:L-alanine-DL-glutamate epimerase-like enolase superfamily enzyme